MAMNADRIFGTGRTAADVRGVFAPRGMDSSVQVGDLLATFKGFGAEGKGREAGLGLFERLKLITPDQRAGVVSGPAAEAVMAADEVVDVVDVAAGGGARWMLGGGAGVGAATISTGSSNPVYGGLYAQMIMREQGLAMPSGGAAAAPAAQGADDVVAAVDTPLAAAADDAAEALVAQREQLMTRFQQLGDLPRELRTPTLAAAVDATASHGDDAFATLTRALLERPVDQSLGALDDAIAAALKSSAGVADDVAKAAPVVDDVVAKAAPLLDDVAKAAPLLDDVAKAAPLLDDVAKAAPLADDALRTGLAGAMSFSAAIDDTLRLLVKLR